jgi:hypothetical protein
MERLNRGYSLDFSDDREAYVIRFLDYLTSGDYQTVALYLLSTDQRAVHFIKDIVFCGFEIVDTAIDNQYQGFIVRLSASCSLSPIIPVGNSYWRIVVNASDPSGITEFSQVEKNSEPLVQWHEGLDDHYFFTSMFAHNLGIYTETESFSKELADHLHYDHFLHYIVHYYDNAHYYAYEFNDRRFLVSVASYEPGGASAVGRFIERLAGITEISFENYRISEEGYRYNPIDDSIPRCGHGGYGVIWRPHSLSFDYESNQYTTVLNFYTDAAAFIIARTIAFIYQVNEDGTYSMLRTRVIYDSGYSISTT